MANTLFATLVRTIRLFEINWIRNAEQKFLNYSLFIHSHRSTAFESPLLLQSVSLRTFLPQLLSSKRNFSQPGPWYTTRKRTWDGTVHKKNTVPGNWRNAAGRRETTAMVCPKRLLTSSIVSRRNRSVSVPSSPSPTRRLVVPRLIGKIRDRISVAVSCTFTSRTANSSAQVWSECKMPISL